jgi:hypothetical protein
LLQPAPLLNSSVLRRGRTHNTRLDERQMRKLHDLDARVTQATFSLKRWSSAQEWEGVQYSAWELIEAQGWDESTPQDA